MWYTGIKKNSLVLQEREEELPEDIRVEDGVIIMKEEGEVKFNMEEDRV